MSDEMIWVAVALACSLWPILALAQDQPPTTNQPSRLLKAELSVVTVTATVTDENGRAARSLGNDDLEVYEDGVRQNVSFVHSDDSVPVSIGVLFDTSGSMVDKIDDVQDAVVHFADTINRDDDIFLMRFSSDAVIVLNSTSDREQFKRAVRGLEPGGSTALYDAVIDGLDRLQTSKQKKKALLLITDGRDTASRSSLKEVIARAKRTEAIIYALGIGHGDKGSFGHGDVGDINDTVDMTALRQLSESTGGTATLLEGKHKRNGVDQVDQAALAVSAELRAQYTIGYYSTNEDKDGAFRRIVVRPVNENLQARTRAGYIPPTQTQAP